MRVGKNKSGILEFLMVCLPHTHTHTQYTYIGNQDLPQTTKAQMNHCFVQNSLDITEIKENYASPYNNSDNTIYSPLCYIS